MKKTLLAATAATMLSTSAMAENIGVTMALFDDNFLTVLRNGIQELADGMEGVDVQIEDAQNDVARQLDQINNFIASGVDAIIVNPVDTSATQAMTDAAAAAGDPASRRPARDHRRVHACQRRPRHRPRACRARPADPAAPP